MMKRTSCLVVLIPLDMDRVKQLDFNSIGISPVYYSSKDGKSCLAEVDNVVFVVSETSMCSTMFQQAMLDALAGAREDSKKWVLKLDDVKIPLGGKQLWDIPEGPPGLEKV
jgi:hypothetical protein